MVWGMALNFGFGDFWPDGDFEYDKTTREAGWYARLTNHYREQPSEEQRRLFDYTGNLGSSEHFYGTFPAGKFVNEPGSSDRNGSMPIYGKVEPHEVPRSWDTFKTHKALGSLIKLSGKILAVDEALKTIIERLEPGVHEFYELPISMPKGAVYPVRYYILRVGQYFDAFSRADSWDQSVDPSGMYPDLLHLNETKRGINGLAFSKAVFNNAHLWRDRQLGFEENLTCFSDELIAEINQADLRIPKHYKMREV